MLDHYNVGPIVQALYQLMSSDVSTSMNAFVNAMGSRVNNHETPILSPVVSKFFGQYLSTINDSIQENLHILSSLEG